MPFGQTQPPAHPYAGPRTQQREQHKQRQPWGGPVWGKSVCRRVEGEKLKKGRWINEKQQCWGCAACVTAWTDVSCCLCWLRGCSPALDTELAAVFSLVWLHLCQQLCCTAPGTASPTRHLTGELQGIPTVRCNALTALCFTQLMGHKNQCREALNLP